MCTRNVLVLALVGVAVLVVVQVCTATPNQYYCQSHGYWTWNTGGVCQTDQVDGSCFNNNGCPTVVSPTWVPGVCYGPGRPSDNCTLVDTGQQGWTYPQSCPQQANCPCVTGARQTFFQWNGLTDCSS
jgi:hypothetical protein